MKELIKEKNNKNLNGYKMKTQTELLQAESAELGNIKLEYKEVGGSSELYQYLIDKIKEDISDCLPLDRICQVVVKHSNKITIGIEEEYYCKDFVAEYSYFY